jgi:RNA polymerase sigma factor (sigma-70 family)
MTNEELAIKIQAGEHQLMEPLWLQVKKLIYYLSQRYIAAACLPVYMDMDDLMQCGYLALEKAVTDYKPEKGFKFSSYIGFHLKNAVFDAAGIRRKKQINADSLNEDVFEDGETELIDTIADTDIDICEEIEYKFLQKVIQEEIDKLDQTEQYIIRQHYFENRTKEAIGKDLGKTGMRIHQIEFKALHKLKRSQRICDIKEAYYGDRVTAFSKPLNPYRLIPDEYITTKETDKERCRSTARRLSQKEIEELRNFMNAFISLR